MGALASIGIILLRYYLEQRKRESAEGKFCYECNKPVPKSYNLVPDVDYLQEHNLTIEQFQTTSPSVKESKNNFAAAVKITTDTKICKYLSLTSIDSRAPTNPPANEPIAKNPA